jgi:hypothetical protein
MMAYKGVFKPINPQKYKGDPTRIIYRSRWELMFMSNLDSRPDVIQWSSEEIIVPYRSPLDNKIHRYFPDFWVKAKQVDGTIKECLIEIKPFYQTQKPKVTKNANRNISEAKTYAINSTKWDYARAYCEQRGWEFIVVTEKDLGLKH